MAAAMAEAGADALELNVYLVAADVEATSAEIAALGTPVTDQEVAELASRVRLEPPVPLIRFPQADAPGGTSPPGDDEIASPN